MLASALPLSEFGSKPFDVEAVGVAAHARHKAQGLDRRKGQFAIGGSRALFHRVQTESLEDRIRDAVRNAHRGNVVVAALGADAELEHVAEDEELLHLPAKDPAAILLQDLIAIDLIVEIERRV